MTSPSSPQPLEDTWVPAWQAAHEPDSGFAGAVALPSDGLVVLAYHGKLRRRGALLWQRNEVDQPAEIHAIDTAVDEARWALSPGEGWDAAEVPPEDVHDALQFLDLFEVAGSLFAVLRWGRDVARTVVADAVTGEARWERAGQAVQRTHVSASDGWVLHAARDAVEFLSLLRGDATGRIPHDPADVDWVALEAKGLVVTPDGALEAWTPTGERRWAHPALWPAAPPSLSRAIARHGSHLAVAAAHRVVLLDEETGTEASTLFDGLGEHLVVDSAGPFLLCQDADSGDVHVALRGAPLDLDEASAWLHWESIAGQGLLVTDARGGIARLDETGAAVWQLTLPGERVAFDALVAGSHAILLAAAPEETHAHIALVDLAAGQLARTAALPLAGPPRLLAASAASVAVATPEGAALYTLR